MKILKMLLTLVIVSSMIPALGAAAGRVIIPVSLEFVDGHSEDIDFELAQDASLDSLLEKISVRFGEPNNGFWLRVQPRVGLRQFGESEDWIITPVIKREWAAIKANPAAWKLTAIAMTAAQRARYEKRQKEAREAYGE